MLNFTELQEIKNYVELYGGFREKNVLNNLIAIELEQNDLKHKVYNFYGNEEIGFKFDIKTKKIVG